MKDSISSYQLRPASDDDYDFLFDLHVSTIRSSVEPIWGWDLEVQRRLFRDKWRRSASRQVVVAEGRDVGVLEVREDEDQVFLGLIEVAPTYQCRGLGTAIITDVVASAHANGKPVVLHVLKSNPAALRLYKRLAFQVLEDRDERWVMQRAP